MKSSLRKLRGFALQRHEQRVDRDRGRGHSTTAAEELLAAAQVRGPCISLPLRGCACACASASASEPGGRVGRLRLWRSRAGASLWWWGAATVPLLVFAAGRNSARSVFDGPVIVRRLVCESLEHGRHGDCVENYSVRISAQFHNTWLDTIGIPRCGGNCPLTFGLA